MYTVPYQISVLRTQRVVVGRQFAVFPQYSTHDADNMYFSNYKTKVEEVENFKRGCKCLWIRP